MSSRFMGIDDAKQIIQYPLQVIGKGINGNKILGVSPALPDDYTKLRKIVQPVLVNRQPGLGDRIFALAAAYAYHQAHPFHQIGFSGMECDKEWLSWIPWLDQHNIDDTNTIVQLNLSPHTAGDRAKAMGRAMGVDVTSLSFPINVPDIGPVIDEEYIVFSPFNNKYGFRSIPSEIVTNVAARTSHKIVVLDAMKHNIEGNNIVNLTGKLKLEEVFGVISRAIGLIGVDSGLMWVANALKIPGLCMFGHVAAEERIACTTDMIGINTVAPCGPCGDMISIKNKCKWMGRTLKCMSYCSPSNIRLFIDMLMEYIESREAK